MPYSAMVFDRHVATLLQRIVRASVLDIGPGAGKYGMIIKALRDSGVAIGASTALEIDAGYIEQFKLADLYDEVRQGDATKLPDIGPNASWDMVILGDVLEHFRKSLGVDLLDYLYYRVKYLVLVVPVDYIQGAADDHAQEAHISLWYADDFARYKATGFTTKTPAGEEIQLILINGLRADPAQDFIFARDLAALPIFTA